jgi:FAD/FMN-containing dehydrogenase
MTSARSVADAAGELADTFSGQLLQPGDAGYDEARRVHNGLVDKRPALIARCRGVADVVDFVKLGRELGLEVAVRGGGHNVARRATVDNGLMIDLAPMKGIHVGPERQDGAGAGRGHLGRTQPRDAIARLSGDCAPTVTTFL